MKKRRLTNYSFAVLLLCLHLMGSFAYAASSGDTSPIKTGGTLSIGHGQTVSTLDLHKDVGTGGVYALRNVFESLVELNEEGVLSPALAVSLPAVVNGKDYVFKLRQGIKFHDGTEFNAQAVKYTYDRLLDPKRSMHAQRLSAFIGGIEVLGPYEVKIVMKQPWVDLLVEMGHWSHFLIMSPAAVEKWGADYGTSAKTVAGTGPFRISDFVKGDRVVMTKNKDYWDPKLPYLDRIVFRQIPEAATRDMNFRTGEIDVMFNVSFSNLKELSKLPNVVTYNHGGGTAHFLAFNTRVKPFNDKRVRQAISMAINRPEIVDVVFGGKAEAATSIWPSWSVGYQADAAVNIYNPDKARQLLKEAGFDKGNPLKFQMYTRDDEIFRDEALLIQHQLEAIGVKAEIEPTPSATALNLLIDGKYVTFLYRLAWGIGTTNFSYRTFSSKSYLNVSKYNMEGGYQNPSVDELLTKASTTLDKKEFDKLNGQISKTIFADDTPVAMTVFENNINLTYNYVRNWQIHAGDFPTRKKVWLNKP